MLIPLLFSAAGLILWGFTFIYIRSYLKRHTGSDLLRKWQDEAGRLIAEIDAATDRDSALVEDRIKTLRALLEDVDRRIAVYVREAGRQKNQEAAYAELGRRLPSAASSPAEAVAVLPPPSPAAGETPPGTAGLSGGGGPAAPELPRIIRSPQPVEPKPPSFSEQVAALVGAGFSPELIASRLGVTLAEVELAAALFRRKQGSGD
ncbi:MAG: hypothetical protein LBU28_00270 [Spirochaetaceae bacterium]|jgi:hypothetical protein|nr:hypothetical protein [Spirochaetaceae bacterium]